MKRYNKKGYQLMAAILMSGILATGCGSTADIASDAVAAEADHSDTSENKNEDKNDNDNDKNKNENKSDTSVINPENADLFSKRDLSGEYDASKCDNITLSDAGCVTDSKNVTINDSTVTITGEGNYMISGSLSDGMIIVDVDKTEKVQLVLNGVDIRSETSAPIYVKSADKVFVTLADGTENMLTNGGSFVAIDDNNIDAVIFSKDDLTLNGTGSLTISSPSGHGVVSKNDLVITSGTYEIMAASHGLSGKESVVVADGSFMITVEKDGIHSEDDEDDTVGWVYIENGSFDIVADSDGISALNEIYIAGGEISITKCEEGLEARLINISGGTVGITSSDDGLNATDKRTSAQTAQGENAGTGSFGGGMGDVHEDANINITGGVVRIDAEGDGVDSNGYITVSGGEVYVLGSSGGGDGALDYGISATISGGVVVAAGQSGMAVNFCDGSTQGSILVNVQSQQQAGTEIVLSDSNGEKIITHIINKSYNSVVVSCPEIVDGGTYTLKTGTEETQITMDGLIYGESRGMGGFGGGHGGMRGGMQDGEMPSGEAPDGKMQRGGKMFPDGERQDGERPNGERPNGEKPDGERPSGGMPNGEMPDGEMPPI